MTRIESSEGIWRGEMDSGESSEGIRRCKMSRIESSEGIWPERMSSDDFLDEWRQPLIFINSIEINDWLR